jgi:Fur family zinc uptake transcriptional regulator
MKKRDIADLMEKAEAFCSRAGIRLTDPRRHVLEIIAASDAPMGAYDILERLSDYMDNPKPPTAYRAIEFLSNHGFIHRIESLNAYVLCGTDHRHKGSQFLICDSCGKVVEAHVCDMPPSLQKEATREGFTIKRWNAELHGLCGACDHASA